DAIPAFVTLITMPFTYSIAYGLIAGIITYGVINTTAFIIRKISGGRIVPYGDDTRDPWQVPGGFLPGWVVRLKQGRKPWDSDSLYANEPRAVTPNEHHHPLEGME